MARAYHKTLSGASVIKVRKRTTILYNSSRLFIKIQNHIFSVYSFNYKASETSNSLQGAAIETDSYALPLMMIQIDLSVSVLFLKLMVVASNCNFDWMIYEGFCIFCVCFGYLAFVHS